MSLLERPSDRDRGGDRDDRVRKKETEKTESERFSTCWFIPQRLSVARSVLTQSQELNLGLQNG